MRFICQITCRRDKGLWFPNFVPTLLIQKQSILLECAQTHVNSTPMTIYLHQKWHSHQQILLSHILQHLFQRLILIHEQIPAKNSWAFFNREEGNGQISLSQWQVQLSLTVANLSSWCRPLILPWRLHCSIRSQDKPKRKKRISRKTMPTWV